MDETKVLVFPVDTYDRWGQLEDCDENELIELANNDDDVYEYTLKEFQDECNNELIDLNGVWVYFVKEQSHD